jgi:hypothetical protein
MAAKLARLTHKIMIQLHLVAESCTICSSHSRRPIRKLLDTPSSSSDGMLGADRKQTFYKITSNIIFVVCRLYTLINAKWRSCVCCSPLVSSSGLLNRYQRNWCWVFYILNCRVNEILIYIDLSPILREVQIALYQSVQIRKWRILEHFAVLFLILPQQLTNVPFPVTDVLK